jgi:hypothetical protein
VDIETKLKVLKRNRSRRKIRKNNILTDLKVHFLNSKLFFEIKFIIMRFYDCPLIKIFCAI